MTLRLDVASFLTKDENLNIERNNPNPDWLEVAEGNRPYQNLELTSNARRS